MNKKIDVTPPTDIYSTFKNYNYRVGTAIPEFLDNSIASFRKNEKAFIKAEKAGKRVEKSIIIVFDKQRNEILIRDSAFGMTSEEIPRALKLKSVPKDRTGLNEFGMGLKTAAFWFGNKLSIITKSPFEKNGFEVELALDELSKGISEVNLNITDKYKARWGLNNGTVIKISGVDRDINNTQTRNVIKTLASKYRRDIVNSGIQFFAYSKDLNGDLIDLNHWNRTGSKKATKSGDLLSGEALKYEPTPRFKQEKEVTLKNGTIPATQDGFEINVEKEIAHRGNIYHLKGKFFIRETGSRPEAGFDLFRRQRIIVEKNKEFITDASSFPYQRINGSIDLDDFPVTQAKDGIDWEGELFTKTKDAIMSDPDFKKLSKISRLIRKDSDNTNKDLSKTVKDFRKDMENSAGVKKVYSPAETQSMAEEHNIEFKESDVAHVIKTDQGEKTIYSSLLISGEDDSWLSVKKIKGITIVYLDVNNAFFNPFNAIRGSGEQFVNTMRKFAVYWAYAEGVSIENSETADDFRQRLSDLIRQNGDNND